jgi:hypothetical protein
MKKVVFVVGAGASKEFGLPLGLELAATIRSRLAGELDSHSNLENSIISIAMQSELSGDYGEAARDLCGGLVSARSIDRLLHSRQDRPLVMELGKCGIALILSEMEAGSPMGSVIDKNVWSTIQDALITVNRTWLAKLYSILHEGVIPAKAETVFENCSFINFNYDRCIQQYLTLAFQHTMSIRPEKVAELVAAIPCQHVYGSLGGLNVGINESMPFGPAPYFARRASQSIQTFTEGAADGTIHAVRALVSEAEVIVFLGFAFDPLNVEALFEDRLGQNQTMVATTFGMSEIEQEKLRAKLHSPGSNIHLLNMECTSLIDNDIFRSSLFG